MRSLLAVAILIAATQGAGAQDTGTPVTYKVPMAPETVNAALGAFAGACKPLVQKYWADMVRAEAVVREPAKRKALDLGSRTMVEFLVTVSDRPQIINREAPKFSYAGHTCSFELYDGTKPRIEIAKQVCKWLCGLSPDANGAADAVIEVPELGVIGQ